ncbi:MAG: adenylyltransferase/cytidyltransferase family protein [Verrucomicrobia bacterium]|nr:adenylyltransferase/cytidyltransferase family protein [Verrucomicrobiota bacterium]
MTRYTVSRSPKSEPLPFFAEKYIPQEELVEKVKKLRSEGKTIATINGSFDLLHAGHLYMLHQASLQADVLIVALNSDASIQQYKSPERPIIPLLDRMKMMAALSFVDFVTSFEETDPRALLEKIRPDVHVNGAEYGENCIEAEVVRSQGGRIHIVDLVPGLSTTQIVKKIKSLCD